MKRIIVLLVILVITFTSCKSSENKTDSVKIAQHYFEILDQSDYSNMSNWFADSLTTIEGGYKQVYSKNEYLEFLKWDAVFDPNYDILEITETNGIVNARISKMDKRIAFLHEEPFITQQTLKFKNRKIIEVETTYLDFKELTWQKNKEALLSWVDNIHPELNGFIYDQTEAGGIKFLRAIELYKNKE
ncbi:hypothetical protein [Winogradskyella sp. PE311]|uniref:hypothetical protein n=1 Tax=Winogradskyella sp. PE311 TaxID=3366943 RepID=UPI0039813E54